MRPSLHSARGLSLLSVFISACGSGGGEGDFNAEKAPYGDRTPTTQTSSTLTLSAGGVVTGSDMVHTTTVVGQKTVGSQTYDRVATTNVSDPNQGGEYWIKEKSDGTVDFAGFDMHSTVAAQVVPQGTVVFDSPITVKKDPPVGQAQAATVAGKFTPAGSTQAIPVTATGQYTLVEKDAVVQTNMGPVSGCNHFAGNLSTSSTLLPTTLQGVVVAGEVWTHPSFGVVAVSAPGLGIQTKMTGSSDCAPVDSSGYRTIRKVGIVDMAHGKFELSSYNCVGDFDADKMTHAKMLLELRWLDETMAKSDIQPTNTYEFQTIFGMFPSMLARSEVSIFHPEENGKGYRYWYAYVSQAAKNEAGSNGISYGVVVSPLTDSPVRASARIYYKVYPWPQAISDGGSTLTSTPDASISRDTAAAIDVSPSRDMAPTIDFSASRDTAPAIDVSNTVAVDAGTTRG